ncbi:hypothetical protein TIFTF001_044954 [Ficus carica]|uniref:Uncharacterized protein n=1 Tax=Ficus carica TaxID=3494 RepID=A0AA87ZKA7_FICCA|nr:hypothetical protein TIFTF001_044954 [Ficus carica]
MEKEGVLGLATGTGVGLGSIAEAIGDGEGRDMGSATGVLRGGGGR